MKGEQKVFSKIRYGVIVAGLLLLGGGCWGILFGTFTKDWGGVVAGLLTLGSTLVLASYYIVWIWAKEDKARGEIMGIPGDKSERDR